MLDAAEETLLREMAKRELAEEKPAIDAAAAMDWHSEGTATWRGFKEGGGVAREVTEGFLDAGARVGIECLSARLVRKSRWPARRSLVLDIMRWISRASVDMGRDMTLEPWV